MLRQGEVWRFLSGHFVHDSGSLAILDLTVLFVFGAWWELRSRRTFAAILVASALAASSAVLAFTDLDVYVGSSAMTSGLFVAAGLELALRERGWIRGAGAVALLLFVAQCVAQSLGSFTWVTLPEGMSVSALAHAAGGVAGGGVALARLATDRSRD